MYKLLHEKRFRSVFITQFMGAFNDNLFKNALVIFIAYKVVTEVESGILSSVAAGLFILPYLLFSIIAGQLADKYEKAAFIVKTKVIEIYAMLLGALGFYLENYYFLLAVLFLMGTQSTFFGPVKYSILPQMFRKDDDLMEATSLIEMGTFLAILIGTILGGVLIAVDKYFVCVAILLFAFLGWLASKKIPSMPISNPHIKLSLNPIKQLKLIFKVVFQSHSIFFSILLISWFWFFGAVFLSQIAVYVKYMVNADKNFVTVFLTAFTLSLSIGSVFCNRLSQKKIELALVVIGFLGMSVFSFDLNLVEYPVFSSAVSSFRDVWYAPEFYTFLRVTIDFFLVGFFGSFYIVPLYAFLQRRSLSQSCSQAIAGNNIVNAIFMVLSTGFGIVVYKLGFSTAQLFAFTGMINVLVFIFVFVFMPEIRHRFFVWLQERSYYRFSLNGFSQASRKERLIIVGDLSHYKMMLLTYFLHKPTRFIVKYSPSFVTILKNSFSRSIVYRNIRSFDFKKHVLASLKRKEIVFISSKDYKILEKKDDQFNNECDKYSVSIYRLTKEKSARVKKFFLLKQRQITLRLKRLSSKK